MEREGGADHGARWRPPFFIASLIVLLWSNHINYGASDHIAPAVVAPLQGTLVGMFFLKQPRWLVLRQTFLKFALLQPLLPFSSDPFKRFLTPFLGLSRVILTLVSGSWFKCAAPINLECVL